MSGPVENQAIFKAPKTFRHSFSSWTLGWIGRIELIGLIETVSLTDTWRYQTSNKLNYPKYDNLQVSMTLRLFLVHVFFFFKIYFCTVVTSRHPFPPQLAFGRHYAGLAPGPCSAFGSEAQKNHGRRGGETVDGWNPAWKPVEVLIIYPIWYRVSYIPGGGYLPWTVVNRTEVASTTWAHWQSWFHKSQVVIAGFQPVGWDSAKMCHFVLRSHVVTWRRNPIFCGSSSNDSTRVFL